MLPRRERRRQHRVRVLIRRGGGEVTLGGGPAIHGDDEMGSRLGGLPDRDGEGARPRAVDVEIGPGKHLPVRIALEERGHPFQAVDLAGGRDDEFGPRGARPAAAGAERDNPLIGCRYLHAARAHSGDRRHL